MKASGARVQQLRELLGLTQKNLAELAGVSQATIARIEGSSDVDADLVRKVARVLNANGALLESLPPLIITHSTAAKFRAHSDLRAWERNRAHRWAEIAYELLTHLRKRVALPNAASLEVYQREPSDDSSDPADAAAEEAAAATRRKLGIRADTPIPDLVRTLERAGVRVLPLPLDGRLHAGLSLVDGVDEVEPLVFLFRGIPTERQRFTLAHELGHIVLHRTETGERRVAEMEANRFAAAFLMPARAFLQDLHDAPATLSTFLRLKPRWGASVSAMVSRSWELGRITDWQRRRLMTDLSSQGWRLDEPVRLPAESPRQLYKAVQLCYGEPPDFGHLARDLQLPRQVIEQLLVDLVQPVVEPRADDGTTVVQFDSSRRRRRPRVESMPTGPG